MGILLAFGLMALLSSITIDLQDNPSACSSSTSTCTSFPPPWPIIANFLIIVIVAFLIAFFTARRAAKLRVADALRHYE